MTESRVALVTGSARGMGRDVGFMRDQNNGVTRFMQAREETHDLDARLRVQVPRGLVGQKD